MILQHFRGSDSIVFSMWSIMLVSLFVSTKRISELLLAMMAKSTQYICSLPRLVYMCKQDGSIDIRSYIESRRI